MAQSGSRQDPEVPSIQECCENCAGMQKLMNQTAQLVDRYRRKFGELPADESLELARAA